MVRRITQKYDPLQITAYGMLLAALCTLPLSAAEIAGGREVTIDLPAVASLLFMGLICTALAHVCWNRSLSMMEAGTCSLFYPVQPLVSALLGALLLGETLDLRFFGGALLIVAGVVLSLWGGRRAESPPPAEKGGTD